jgi:DNA primase catalytic subunit
MRFAMQIIDRVLHGLLDLVFLMKEIVSFEEDFGFEHRLWIYSGRRGVHCWVCDQTARELQSSIRQAIVEHLTVLTVGLVLLFECFMYLYLGRKRFSKTCNTLFSITSITSVKKQNLIY